MGVLFRPDQYGEIEPCRSGDCHREGIRSRVLWLEYRGLWHCVSNKNRAIVSLAFYQDRCPKYMGACGILLNLPTDLPQ